MGGGFAMALYVGFPGNIETDPWIQFSDSLWLLRCLPCVVHFMSWVVVTSGHISLAPCASRRYAQSQSGDPTQPLPFAVMTSGDTHEPTVEMFQRHAAWRRQPSERRIN